MSVHCRLDWGPVLRGSYRLHRDAPVFSLIADNTCLTMIVSPDVEPCRILLCSGSVLIIIICLWVIHLRPIRNLLIIVFCCLDIVVKLAMMVFISFGFLWRCDHVSWLKIISLIITTIAVCKLFKSRFFFFFFVKLKANDYIALSACIV